MTEFQAHSQSPYQSPYSPAHSPAWPHPRDVLVMLSTKLDYLFIKAITTHEAQIT